MSCSGGIIRGVRVSMSSVWYRLALQPQVGKHAALPPAREPALDAAAAARARRARLGPGLDEAGSCCEIALAIEVAPRGVVGRARRHGAEQELQCGLGLSRPELRYRDA